MPLPPSFEGRLRLPVIAAPMFLASGPEMVLACCRAGIVGSFPAKNRRTREGLDEWLTVIGEGLAAIEAGTFAAFEADFHAGRQSDRASQQ